MLIKLTMTYDEKVLVGASSKIINRVRKVITKKNWSWQWKLGGRPILVWSCLDHLSCPTNLQGDGVLTKMAPPSTNSGPTVYKEVCLNDILGHVCTTQRAMIPLFGTVYAYGKTDV